MKKALTGFLFLSLFLILCPGRNAVSDGGPDSWIPRIGKKGKPFRSCHYDIHALTDAPTTHISFETTPTAVLPDEDFPLTVNVNSDLENFGYRGRIFLEIRNAENDELITRHYRDKLGQGYQGPLESVAFTCRVPGTYSSVYFIIYLSPIGFNPWIVQETQTYPRDGSYPYKWTGNGVTHDIVYLDSTVISDNVDGNYCYCCGITYEAFMDAWETYNSVKGNDPADIWGVTYSQMRSFRSKWYAADGTLVGAPGSIEKYDCGFMLSDFETARAGDFVQIWRSPTSGHSVIFHRWIRDTEGNRIKMEYWSTQPGTNGIDYNTETWTEYMENNSSFGRAIKPVDDDDWKNRFPGAEAITSPIPVGDLQSGRSGYYLY